MPSPMLPPCPPPIPTFSKNPTQKTKSHSNFNPSRVHTQTIQYIQTQFHNSSSCKILIPVHNFTKKIFPAKSRKSNKNRKIAKNSPLPQAPPAAPTNSCNHPLIASSPANTSSPYTTINPFPPHSLSHTTHDPSATTTHITANSSQKQHKRKTSITNTRQTTPITNYYFPTSSSTPHCHSRNSHPNPSKHPPPSAPSSRPFYISACVCFRPQDQVKEINAYRSKNPDTERMRGDKSWVWSLFFFRL